MSDNCPKCGMDLLPYGFTRCEPDESEQANQILSDACAKALNERDQWHDVAGRLAEACRNSYDAREWPADGTSEQEKAVAAYDALAQQAEGGKG